MTDPQKKPETDVAVSIADLEGGGEGILRLEQQEVNGAYLDNRYEVWHSGVYRRKVFSVRAEDGAPPRPSLNDPAPMLHERSRLEKVAGRPAYISAVGYRADDQRELIGLTFLQGSEPDDPNLSPEERQAQSLGSNVKGEKWETVWVTYSQIADARKLLETLGDHVFPVRTSNAKAMSDYLTDCYDANVGLSLKSTIVKRAGHHFVNDRHGWLVGDRWVGYGRVTPDPNKDKLTKALRTHGSAEEWIRFTRGHWERDKNSWILRWILGAVFTAPLLRHIGERTFVTHHYTQSGGAKSTMAFLAQSAWGHPREFSLALNRVTQNSVVEVFNYISDLPLLLDELQGKEIDASDMIMQACTEEPKQRVKQDGGLHEVRARAWRTLIITTGEQTLAGADKADVGGQRNRVLELRHPGLSVAQGEELWQSIETPKHYGFAGLKFLENLLPIVNDEVRLKRLRARFSEYVSTIAKWTGERRAQERQLGAIAVAESLMLQWVYGFEAHEAATIALRDACDVGKNWLRTRDGNNSLWQKAIEYLVEHKHSNPNLYADATTELGKSKLSLYGSKTSQPLVAAYNAGPKCNELWYFPNAIDKVLREKFQIPPDRIWEELAGEGILDRGADRLVKARQIQGVMKSTKVFVAFADRLTSFEPEPVTIDASELSSYVPCEYDSDDYLE